jgi:hypothetical protein
MPDVTVRVLDQDSLPVEDVMVHLYDSDNRWRTDYGLTDSAGEVDFTGVDEGDAWIRLFAEELHATVETPQLLDVRAAPATNIFEVGVILPQAPAPRSPNTCRIYGWFHNIDLTRKRLMLHLSSWEDPVLVVGAGETGRQLPVQSDDNGYFEFDLVRDGLYSATIPGYENEPIIFRVPEVESCRIEDLLFPVPVTLTFDPTGPLAMTVGDEECLEDTTLLLTSGYVLNADNNEDVPFRRYVTYTSSDEEVATVTWGSDGIPCITAVGPGTADISAEIGSEECASGIPITRPEATLTVAPGPVSVTVT